MITGHRDPRIREAFASVPREPFAGPGPWRIKPFGPVGYVETPDDDPAFLYQDALVALDAERGINIGQPCVHALWLDAIRLQPGERVLQVGAGSGYYTAILAHLVGPEGRVFAYEIDQDLAARARANLKDLPQVKLRAESAIADGLPKVDTVYVCTGITQPSWAWIDALRPGGRLLFPLQPPDGLGGMLLIERPAQGAVVAGEIRLARRLYQPRGSAGCRSRTAARQGILRRLGPGAIVPDRRRAGRQLVAIDRGSPFALASASLFAQEPPCDPSLSPAFPPASVTPPRSCYWRAALPCSAASASRPMRTG
jgi:protein-L-isoaspartate(D-aspartate) O-methyltransferase